MKKKIIIIATTVFILLIGGYIIYKSILLHTYNLDKIVNNEVFKAFEKGMQQAKNITIKKDMTSPVDYEVLQIEGLTLRNDFTTFEKSEESEPFGLGIKFTKYDENQNPTEAFWISVGSPYISYMKMDYEIFGDETKIGAKEGREKFLKDNNIKTDFEFFKYILDHKDDKANLFTNTEKIKRKYEAYQFFQIISIFSEDITLIKGDLEGYIVKKKNSGATVCYLYENDKLYQLTFFGNNFSDSYINDLLSTIDIEDKD
ncbi:MAG: hypothetical protein K2M17_00185 [Bacilli bacterium]|nr:hypothetical protein [Bacilli bacterium]